MTTAEQLTQVFYNNFVAYALIFIIFKNIYFFAKIHTLLLF